LIKYKYGMAVSIKKCIQVLWKSISCFKVLLLRYRQQHNNTTSVSSVFARAAFDFTVICFGRNEQHPNILLLTSWYQLFFFCFLLLFTCLLRISFSLLLLGICDYFDQVPRRYFLVQYKPAVLYRRHVWHWSEMCVLNSRTSLYGIHDYSSGVYCLEFFDVI